MRAARGLLGAVTAAVLTAAFLCPGSAAAATRAEQWRAIAQRAFDRFDVLDAGGTLRAMTLAHAAQVAAWLSPSGWQDPAAQAYLDRLYATRNPDGGWGLGFAYDAHNDGSTNAANTTYTVTLAGHVGPVLLDAWRAGVVPLADLQTVFQLVATAPRIDTAAGRCIAYSRDPDDARAGYCVHNVNAGAAWFLWEAGNAGVAPIPWWLVSGITRRTASAQSLESGRLGPYRDASATTPDDPDHASYTAESMLTLAPPVGYVSGYHLMGDTGYPVSHMLLTAAPRAPGGADWCVLGDRWLSEADAWVTASWSDAGRLAQAAYYATRAARACA